LGLARFEPLFRENEVDADLLPEPPKPSRCFTAGWR
jgi:hypothetical protein